MPIHDWTRVEAGIFHHFHHRWITSISDTLNAGMLPAEYYALAEQEAKAAVTLAPDRARAYASLAAIYVHQHKWDQLDEMLVFH